MACCPVCGGVCDPRVLAKATGLYPPLVPRIQRRHPSWRPDAGLCPGCARAVAEEFAAERAAVSLQAHTEPPTTFPYYHPDEEAVLGQTDRLPAHTGFGGAGVTIAFLDSGYYPHPDLTTAAEALGDAPWIQLSHQELHARLGRLPLRLRAYADLTDGAQREGLALASLWDAAGDSWHGHMTTTVAAGNGALSHGRFRGYAPAADLLPIKIGRGGGRIPEEDILAGLEWLLAEDRVARYGVRVLNVSVGGDFVEPWHVNAVCRAAEALVARGVFVAAAAGNSAVERILAPAQAPSVLTVGGVDDFNRKWRPSVPADVAHLALYPHNWGTVDGARRAARKPEVLALGRWLPAPVLPPSPVFDEMHALARLRESLLVEDAHLGELAAHWVQALHSDPVYRKRHADESPADWRSEMWQALRKRMNAHKWIHAHYQHVDGTSVAVAQVSAVAAQMLEANPALTPAQVKSLLVETALPLRHLPAARRGAGLLQPARAVASALRAAGGTLVGRPCSGTRPRPLPDAPIWGARGRSVYVGLLARHASAVSVIGAFNGWQPGATALARAGDGWWHGIVRLPPGDHAYRFWVEGGAHGTGDWLADPEQPERVEGGYTDDHSCIAVPG